MALSTGSVIKYLEEDVMMMKKYLQYCHDEEYVREEGRIDYANRLIRALKTLRELSGD